MKKQTLKNKKRKRTRSILLIIVIIIAVAIIVNMNNIEKINEIEVEMITIPTKIINAHDEDATIYEIYISSAENNEWGENLLGDEQISFGDEEEIELTIDANKTLWDIKTVDKSGKETMFEDIDFSDINQEEANITLIMNLEGISYAVAE